MRVKERPQRVYLPWTVEEDQRLVEAYREGKTAEQLSSIHQRSLGAIRSRLLHLADVRKRARPE